MFSLFVERFPRQKSPYISCDVGNTYNTGGGGTQASIHIIFTFSPVFFFSFFFYMGLRSDHERSGSIYCSCGLSRHACYHQNSARDLSKERPLCSGQLRGHVCHKDNSYHNILGLGTG